MPLSTPVALACAGDENYAMPMAVTLYSALSHLPPQTPVELFLCDGGMTEGSKAKIASVVRSFPSAPVIHWIQPQMSDLEQLSAVGHVNASAYVKVIIPQLVPAHLEKIIYLDSDLIIETDLSALWETEMEDNALLAVRDYGIPFVSSPGGLPPQHWKPRFAPDTKYCNSGLLVFNLPLWRQQSLSEKALQYAADYDEIIRYADQEAINAVVGDNWRELDPRWNVQIDAILNYKNWPPSAFKDALQPVVPFLVSEARILHYTGAKKPWKGGIRNPALSRFFRYLAQSGWFSKPGFALWSLTWLQSCVHILVEERRKKRAG